MTAAEQTVIYHIVVYDIHDGDRDTIFFFS